MEYLIAFVCGGIFTVFGVAFWFNVLSYIDSWERFCGVIGWKRMEERLASQRREAQRKWDARFAPKSKACDACGERPGLWEDHGYVWRGDDFALCESCFETWLWDYDLAEDHGRTPVPMAEWAAQQHQGGA